MTVARFEGRALFLSLLEKSGKQPAQYKLVVRRVDYAFVFFRGALELGEQVPDRPYYRTRAEGRLAAAYKLEHNVAVEPRRDDKERFVSVFSIYLREIRALSGEAEIAVNRYRHLSLPYFAPRGRSASAR